MRKRQSVCGEYIDISPNEQKIKTLNLELVRHIDLKGEIEYYEIHFEDWTPKGKSKVGVRGTKLLQLNIRDAIKLKSIIDNLVYDATEDAIENKLDKIPYKLSASPRKSQDEVKG